MWIFNNCFGYKDCKSRFKTAHLDNFYCRWVHLDELKFNSSCAKPDQTFGIVAWSRCWSSSVTRTLFTWNTSFIAGVSLSPLHVRVIEVAPGSRLEGFKVKSISKGNVSCTRTSMSLLFVNIGTRMDMGEDISNTCQPWGWLSRRRRKPRPMTNEFPVLCVRIGNPVYQPASVADGSGLQNLLSLMYVVYCSGVVWSS